jgi:hypothetical protein
MGKTNEIKRTIKPVIADLDVEGSDFIGEIFSPLENGEADIVEVAVISSSKQLAKMLFPHGLACIYCHHGALPKLNTQMSAFNTATAEEYINNDNLFGAISKRIKVCDAIRERAAQENLKDDELNKLQAQFNNLRSDMNSFSAGLERKTSLHFGLSEDQTKRLQFVVIYSVSDEIAPRITRPNAC